jgi:hypothetical protein
MADLTNLESKLGEVTGLAMAAQVATERVMKLAEEEAPELVTALEKMNQEAAETERRCTELAGSFDGKKTAILDEARATKAKGAEMLKIYLDADSDALDGFEFLTMAVAGEVGHWGVLQQMSGRGGHEAVGELTRWALPIQHRHLEGALAGSEKLAPSEDPDEEV